MSKLDPNRRAKVVLAVSIGMSLVMGLTSPSAGYVRPGETELVSVSSQARQGSNCGPTPDLLTGCGSQVWETSLSRSGRFVAFASHADGLVGGDVNQLSDVFVRDRTTGKTEMVSVSSGGDMAIGPPERDMIVASYSSHGGNNKELSYDPTISADGRFVAFTSAAVNLVDGDTNLASDVFVHDRKSGKTERVSVSSDGDQGTLDATDTRKGLRLAADSFYPAISGNGRYVSFASFATNLVKGDTNGYADVFVHDRKTDKTSRVSVKSNGEQSAMDYCTPSGTCYGWLPRSAISTSGRFVTFDTNAPDLAKPDTNGVGDVFVHDRKNGRTERVSVLSSGAQSAPERCVEICIAFSWLGASLSGSSVFETAGRAISGNGRYVTFVSRSGDLVPNDTNEEQPELVKHRSGLDIFVHDRKEGRTRRISVTSTGAESRITPHTYPAISANGRFVVWQADLGVSESDKILDKLEIGHASAISGIYIHDLRSGETRRVTQMKVLDRYGFPLGMVPDISPTGRLVSFTSMHWPRDWKMKDANEGTDTFLVDRGEVVGGGLTRNRSGGPDPEPPPLICIQSICLPPAGSLRVADSDDDATPAKPFANLLGGRIAYRPTLDDLYVTIELESFPRTPLLAAATAGTLYGMSFDSGGRSYEVRVASSGVGATGDTTASFDLLSCASGSTACREVTDVVGGFGTTGDEIVFSVPLEEIGLEAGGKLSNVTTFTALGTPAAGPTQILDTVKIASRG